MKALEIGRGGARAVLVHGNDLCGAFYVPFATELARRDVTTTLLTLPGFHHEPPLAHPTWGGLVDAVLEAGAAPGTTLIGHSLGGLVALLAAARRRPEVTRLVLLEPTLYPSRWLARAAARRYLASVVRGRRDRFENWNGGQWRIAAPDRFPQALLELYLEVRRTSDRATAEALFTSLPALYPLPFAAVRVPTLLVRGAEAGAFSALIHGLVARRLPADRVVIPGAAHWLANERDDLLAEHVAAFIHRGGSR